MIKYRTKAIARILFIIYLIAVAYLCFWRFNDNTVITQNFLGLPADKVVHFLIFLPFPFLLYYSIGKVAKKAWAAVLFVLFIFVLGCAIAASTELIQNFIPYREGDSLDFLSDAIALFASSVAVSIINAKKRKEKIEE